MIGCGWTGTQVISQETADDAIRAFVRLNAASQSQVVGVGRLFREKVGEHLHDVRFRAGLQIAPGRELFLERSNLVREPEHVQVADVRRLDERDGGAGLAGASRSPRPMDVLLAGFGEVVVDDVREVGNVDAAGRDVGTPRGNGAWPFRVASITFSRSDCPRSALSQSASKPCCVKRGRDPSFVDSFVLQNTMALSGFSTSRICKRSARLVASRNVDVVTDLERPDVVPAQSDELGGLEPRLREALDLRGKRRAEEQGLSRCRRGTTGCRRSAARTPSTASRRSRRGRRPNALWIERAAPQVIEHAARRARDDLRAVVDLLDLCRPSGAPP